MPGIILYTFYEIFADFIQESFTTLIGVTF